MGSFSGNYALKGVGKSRGGLPDDLVGLLSSDGKGNVTGNTTENKDGTVCQFSLNGTYTVNPNGTGTITLAVTPLTPGCTANPSKVASVLFQMGNGAAFISINGGAGLGTLTKQ